MSRLKTGELVIGIDWFKDQSLSNIVQDHMSKELIDDISTFRKKAFPDRDSFFERLPVDDSEVRHSYPVIAEQLIDERFDVPTVISQCTNPGP
jgi:hypothetical protein